MDRCGGGGGGFVGGVGGGEADGAGCVSAAGDSDDLCGAAVWGDGCGADGGVSDLLLRVPLSLHRGDRACGVEEHSGGVDHEAAVSSGDGYVGGAVGDDCVCESEPEFHAAGDAGGVCDAV